jgi:hypothetical protein
MIHMQDSLHVVASVTRDGTEWLLECRGFGPWPFLDDGDFMRESSDFPMWNAVIATHAPEWRHGQQHMVLMGVRSGVIQPPPRSWLHAWFQMAKGPSTGHLAAAFAHFHRSMESLPLPSCGDLEPGIEQILAATAGCLISRDQLSAIAQMYGLTTDEQATAMRGIRRRDPRTFEWLATVKGSQGMDLASLIRRRLRGGLLRRIPWDEVAVLERFRNCGPHDVRIHQPSPSEA